jgi:hypothetical protein
MAMEKSVKYPIEHILIHFTNNAFFGDVDDNECVKGPTARVRKGAAQDAKNVALAAGLLNASFIQKDDLPANTIQQEVLEIKRRVDSSPKEYGALLFIIASHGNENVIIGTDYNEVNIYQDIVRPLHNFNCEGLRGKPKIFIINACRGERGKDSVIYDKYDSENSSTKKYIAHDTGLVIKSEITGTLVQDIGDFALIFSTGPESVSVRDPENGSPLIRNLFMQIKEFAESGKLRTEEFTDIFKKVQRKVNLECGTSPGITNHLVKDMFLPTKGKVV